MSKRLDGVHAQTSILPAPHNLAPIADQVRARLQHPERGTKRRRRLQALRGEVVHDRLLVRCIQYITSSQKTKTKSQLRWGGWRMGGVRRVREKTGSREEQRVVRRGDPACWARIRQRARLWLMLPLAHTEPFFVCLCRGPC